MKRTFAEKIFNAKVGDVVYREPNVILSHDNSARIEQIFRRLGGEKVYNPDKLFVVLDQKERGEAVDLMDEYQHIHKFIVNQGIVNFHDCDKGICHHVLIDYLKRGMLVVGNDSHTCMAGAFDCMSLWIKKTETAHLWKYGKMWFRVPETIKINLEGKLREGVYAKDAALWITGMLKNENVDFQCIEYHGDGVESLNISDRITIANAAIEMGATCSVFPPDDVLSDYFHDYLPGIWADEGALYSKEFNVNLSEIMPLVYDLEHGEQVHSVTTCQTIDIQQGVLGSCASGRIEDLRVAAQVLKGKKIKEGFTLYVVPASREIYLQALDEGIIHTLTQAGATILGASCRVCMGRCKELFVEGKRFIATTNSFAMNSTIYAGMEKYIASPATVAATALNGCITPAIDYPDEKYLYWNNPRKEITVNDMEIRKHANVWDYSDIDDIQCTQLCVSNIGHGVSLDTPDAIIPYLLNKLDVNFVKHAKSGDVILGGDAFGWGNLSKFAAVGLRKLGIVAIIAKSVNRNFYRMAMNHGLLILIAPEIVEAYKIGDKITVDFEHRNVYVGGTAFALPHFDPIIDKMLENGGMIFV